MRPRLPSGPPPALVPWLDRACEWWAGCTPRARWAGRALVVAASICVVVRGPSTGWGPTVTAWVATTNLAAGHVLVEGDLTARPWPGSLLPDLVPTAGTGSTSTPPLGQVLALGVPAGSPVTTGHLRGPTLADLAPADHVVVAVSVTHLGDVPIGATVDVHAGNGASVLGAVVLDRTTEQVWLAVPRAQAAALADALAWGEVLVAVLSTA